jgi:hypothetical protein
MSGRTIIQGALLAAGLAAATPAAAQYPEPREAVWVARDFRFHTGEVMPELRLGYLTIGEPSGTPVLVLHGTAGSSRSMVSPAFAGQLFGPGQPLDAAKHYIIIPDALGAGKSSKPSDGMRARFPRFNYADILAAQHRLLTEGLGISHVRLIIGNSMGGMLAWLWGVTGFHGRHCAHGRPAHGHVRAELDAAAHDDRNHPARPCLSGGQLQQPAGFAVAGLPVLQYRDQWRVPGAAKGGA